jgi:hypothetical protein
LLDAAERTDRIHCDLVDWLLRPDSYPRNSREARALAALHGLPAFAERYRDVDARLFRRVADAENAADVMASGLPPDELYGWPANDEAPPDSASQHCRERWSDAECAFRSFVATNWRKRGAATLVVAEAARLGLAPALAQRAAKETVEWLRGRGRA